MWMEQPMAALKGWPLWRYFKLRGSIGWPFCSVQAVTNAVWQGTGLLCLFHSTRLVSRAVDWMCLASAPPLSCTSTPFCLFLPCLIWRRSGGTGAHSTTPYCLTCNHRLTNIVLCFWRHLGLRAWNWVVVLIINSWFRSWTSRETAGKRRRWPWTSFMRARTWPVSLWAVQYPAANGCSWLWVVHHAGGTQRILCPPRKVQGCTAFSPVFRKCGDSERLRNHKQFEEWSI